MRRDMTGPDNRAAWILPSPNMPTPETATLYPRHGLVRGHQHVRRSRNHPAVRTHRRALRGLSLGGGLNSKGLAGVTFREAYFQPTLSKNQGLICGGVQVHITDAPALKPWKWAPTCWSKPSACIPVSVGVATADGGWAC